MLEDKMLMVNNDFFLHDLGKISSVYSLKKLFELQSQYLFPCAFPYLE